MAKVCLDPGHAGGDIDPGAVNAKTGLQEAAVNLAVASQVKKYLEAVGYEVLMTRTKAEQAETDSLAYRCELANHWGAEVVVSIHCNSAASGKANGTEIYTTLGETAGDQLATCIINQVTDTFPDIKLRADWDDGDPDKEENFYVLRYTDAPAVLLEMAFISNSAEAKKLADSNWQKEMSRAIARGISDYYAELSS
ncbi:N-acetylmuramoyl-L-alanine amidase family protein [Sporomusa acidovorans]|uniref:N-acetylmuramoyl-L-alanine amidase AmiC n=1 Tax=Sporomusa acidovorans (strain ATCC 49682 / DSM 3132 / Mol) TaxID=1123286 RepID=A0ABZ3J567_SPOA4|nr:N-acetylmuramoyl-L-alanine amidase [Sporomusa acidovorans]OZC15658.1 N-acetylmuramoyl-L-alanine amidase AmiC precursor [Sporomusa acidovorans DSM 3132]SDE88350.1 N-acetylmuramoyl-L-alanine amidase [Sporomusa acidovorans]